MMVELSFMVDKKVVCGLLLSPCKLINLIYYESGATMYLRHICTFYTFRQTNEMQMKKKGQAVNFFIILIC